MNVGRRVGNAEGVRYSQRRLAMQVFIGRLSRLETSFIMTEILITSQQYSFAGRSRICLGEGLGVARRGNGLRGGCDIKVQACIIPRFYDKYWMKTPVRAIEACI